MLIKCKECGKDISSDAKKCPNCGKKKAPSNSAIILILLFGFIIFVLMYQCGKVDADEYSNSLNTTSNTPTTIVQYTQDNSINSKQFNLLMNQGKIAFHPTLDIMYVNESFWNQLSSREKVCIGMIGSERVPSSVKANNVHYKIWSMTSDGSFDKLLMEWPPEEH